MKTFLILTTSVFEHTSYFDGSGDGEAKVDEVQVAAVELPEAGRLFLRDALAAAQATDQPKVGAAGARPVKTVPREYWQGQIFIQTLTGNTITLDAAGIDTIAEIKEKIQDKEGIPPDHQTIYIMYCKQVQDHMHLCYHPGGTPNPDSYNIGSEETLLLVLQIVDN